MGGTKSGRRTSSALPQSLRECLTRKQKRRWLLKHGADLRAVRELFAEACSGWTDVSARFIENVVGCSPVPLGIATGFVINGQPHLVTLATEERSVVAAISKAAKLCRPQGFNCFAADSSRTSGHALWSGVADPERLIAAIHAHEDDILRCIRRNWEECETHGRRLCGLRAYRPPGPRTDLLTVQVFYDAGETMGANAVTRIAGLAADALDPVIGSRRIAAIVSNDGSACGDTVAEAVWPAGALPGGVVGRILDLQAWAESDPLRLATHVKGIMNGVSAVCLATGQDVRAVEAAVHTAAHRPSGQNPLTQYFRTEDGGLKGRLTVPLPVAAAGGATSHPIAAACRRLMGTPDRRRLAEVMAAVGLAANFASLLCLAGEGIIEAHRRLRTR